MILPKRRYFKTEAIVSGKYDFQPENMTAEELYKGFKAGQIWHADLNKVVELFFTKIKDFTIHRGDE